MTEAELIEALVEAVGRATGSGRESWRCRQHPFLFLR
jgi:hypothetical protein